MKTLKNENKPAVKEDLVDIRDFEEKDYRGVLALLAVGGYFALVALVLFLHPELILEVLSANSLAILALNYYFHIKE